MVSFGRLRWSGFLPIFIHNRDQNEKVGEESDEIRKRFILVGIVTQSQSDSIQSLQ